MAVFTVVFEIMDFTEFHSNEKRMQGLTGGKTYSTSMKTVETCSS
jgi:hypothetical protein